MLHKYKEYFPLVFFLLLLVLAFFIVKPFLASVFVGGLLAFVFYPLYRWFTGRWNKHLSAVVVCLLVLVIIVVPLFFFMEALIKESYNLYLIAKQRFSLNFLQECGTLCSLDEIPLIGDQYLEIFKRFLNWIVGFSSNFLLGLPGFLLNIFVVFTSLFYSLIEGPKFVEKFANHFFPEKKQTLVLQRLKEITQGIVYGYFSIALLQGFLGGLGFLIFGVPSPLFWGFVMAILALIPYLGTGLIWAPAAIMLIVDGAISDSNWLIFKGLALFLYGLLIVSMVDNILRPKIVERKTKIHSLVILLGILGGMTLFGPVGIILGPLILSLVMVLLEIGLNV